MKNIPKKFKIFLFLKNKKSFGHMAQGKPQPKFERNWCNNFRDNRCHRWTDEFRFHELWLLSQAELKNLICIKTTCAYTSYSLVRKNCTFTRNWKELAKESFRKCFLSLSCRFHNCQLLLQWLHICGSINLLENGSRNSEGPGLPQMISGKSDLPGSMSAWGIATLWTRLPVVRAVWQARSHAALG